MGSAGTEWETADTFLDTRLNQKTQAIGNSNQLNSITTTYPGQAIYPLDAGNGWLADRPDSRDAANTKWEYVGLWYTAGANVYIYSNPRGELDLRQLNIQISNRKFRDDEFLIPAKLTANKSAIKVRVKFVPNNQELYPRLPYPKESAWSELRYQAYSFVIPGFPVKK